MKTYKVYFEFYNKKMQCTIDCLDKSAIFNKIADKIIIKEVQEINEENETLDNLKNIFGFK